MHRLMSYIRNSMKEFPLYCLSRTLPSFSRAFFQGLSARKPTQYIMSTFGYPIPRVGIANWRLYVQNGELCGIKVEG